MISEKLKEELKNIKKGDIVSLTLNGTGLVSDGEDSEVFHVDKKSGLFWIGEWDEKYRKDSIYAHSIETGQTVNNIIPAFFKQVTHVKKSK